MVCVFCGHDAEWPMCHYCNDYKGLVTIEEWEALG